MNIDRIILQWALPAIAQALAGYLVATLAAYFGGARYTL